MQERSASDKLKEAIKLVKSGDEARARPLLVDVVKADRANDEAWVWLAAAVETDEQRTKCLQEALRANPQNQIAANALAKLKGRQQQPAAPAPQLAPAAPAPADQAPQSEADPQPDAALGAIALGGLILILAVIVGGVLLFVDFETIGWQTFSSQEGGFSVRVPDTPTQEVVRLQTSDGSVDLSRFSVAGEGNARYQVGYADLSGTADLNAAFNDLREQVVARFSGSPGTDIVVSNESSIALSGYPGMAYEAQVTVDGLVYRQRVRVYLVGERFYSVLVAAPEDLFPARGTDGYLKSFKLLQ